MVYDEGLVQRVREILSENMGCEEKKMFGGTGFFLQGTDKTATRDIGLTRELVIR